MIAAEPLQGGGGFGMMGAAVMHHAPDVADQGVVIGCKLGKAGYQAGGGHGAPDGMGRCGRQPDARKAAETGPGDAILPGCAGTSRFASRSCPSAWPAAAAIIRGNISMPMSRWAPDSCSAAARTPNGVTESY